MSKLFSVPISDRDAAWEQAFLTEFGRSVVEIVEPEPVRGPDGWPYLMVSTDLDSAILAQRDGGQRQSEQDAVQSISRWLAGRGIGLVINPEKPMPDFVLPYGAIWNFVEFGEFLTPITKPISTGGLEITDGQSLLTGPPSTSFLPPNVRSVLRDFFVRQKVNDVRVLMIADARDPEPARHWDLAFSLESLGQPPPSEHHGIAEAIAWFLPAHYSVALVSERVVPGFVTL